MPRAIALLPLPLVLAISTPALADTDDMSFGARVGGYGFRRDTDSVQEGFTECRMNGLGVFGEHRFGKHLFVESGLDMYFSQSFPTGDPAADDLPIDRMSGLVTVAGGLRAAATSRISGYAQLGVGVELTRVSVPYDGGSIDDQKAMPAGFLGVGGDIRVGAKTYLGANFRAHIMGNFEYDPARLEMESGWTTPPSADEVFDPSPDLAAQGQFYIRRDL
jgi:hypothetical protein